jgi:hypothetical protein
VRQMWQRRRRRIPTFSDIFRPVNQMLLQQVIVAELADQIYLVIVYIIYVIRG